jgi:hypothetical protein
MTSLLQFRIKVRKIPPINLMHFAHLICDDHVLFTCLYVGSSMQNASQQFVHFFSTFPSASKPTNNNLQQSGLDIQTTFISVTIQTRTHAHVNFFSHKDHLQKYWTFLLNHPVYIHHVYIYIYIYIYIAFTNFTFFFFLSRDRAM